MKALTIRQPWAELIALGVKHIETRSWRTSYRGPLAIHAGAWQPSSYLRVGDYHVRGYGRTGLALEGPGLPPFRSTPRLSGHLLHLGRVVASAQLVDCVPITKGGAWPTSWNPPCPAEAAFVDSRGCDLPREVWPDQRLTLFSTERHPVLDIRYAIDVGREPLGDWTEGRWAWLLEDIRPFPAQYPAKGRQGLWEWDEGLG